MARIRENRARLSEAQGRGRFRWASASTLSRIQDTERLIAGFARGRALDVGCGHMPFRDSVLSHARSYEGLDVEARVEGVTYITSAAEMDGVPPEAFDTVLCSEVLEHVPDPGRVLAAIRRVVRPGGHLLVTVPHLSRLHEEPHDYFRYTGYGLRAVLETAGFEVIEIKPRAGLFSFLSHQASTLLLGLSWGIPLVRTVAYQLNRFLLVHPAIWADRVLDPRSLFPLGYSAVARRPPEGSEDQAGG